MPSINAAEQAARLREQLDKLQWPQAYMFKFVMPNDPLRVERVRQMLPQDGRMRADSSRTGKYVSLTCVATMPSADAVMEVTTKICQVEGVISL